MLHVRERAIGGQRGAMRALALAMVLSTGCSSVRLVEVQQSDFLYFGTNRPNAAPVSDAEWRVFVDEVITPRFPGFTEWIAEGHWKAEREPTHIVQIVHGRRGGEQRKMAEIIAEYKRRFRQEAVLWIRTDALATLE